MIDAATAAERAAARHPQPQAICLDTALVDQIESGTRRQRQRRVFELWLELDFAGIGLRGRSSADDGDIGHSPRIGLEFAAGTSLLVISRAAGGANAPTARQCRRRDGGSDRLRSVKNWRSYM
jgi:hypothetical protein